LAATRVYILAKELGVKSSAIVKKCQNEGLDVKNHMSAISAGLAATIREWFSEGENITTIETSTKVDLKKVRIRKKKTVKKAKPKAPENQDTTQATAAAQTGTASAVIDDKEAPSEEETGGAATAGVATEIFEVTPEPSEVKPIKKKKATKAKSPKPVPCWKNPNRPS
jgi:translation initiation factor IF-2